MRPAWAISLSLLRAVKSSASTTTVRWGYIMIIHFHCVFLVSHTHTAQLLVASRVEVQSMHPLQFNVICTSFGGFPASVAWMKDSSLIEGGVTSLSDDFTSYRHILSNVTEEGLYTCIVSNDTPDNASATANATSEYSVPCVRNSLYE